MDSADAAEQPGIDLSRLSALPASLAECDVEQPSEAELIDLISAAERAKSALAALQARASAALHDKRCHREAAGGVPASQLGRGLAAEIALARGESPHKGSRLLGLARALVEEMPQTLAALRCGNITEWRATVVVKETAVLTQAHRRQVDAEIGPELAGLGDRQAGAAARAIGYRLDPGSSLRRIQGADRDRRVSVRPAPDAMTYLTGFLPVRDGVACQVALQRAADAAKAAGDERSRGQLMADLLVERVTGRDPASSSPDIQLHLVMDQVALLPGPTGPGSPSAFTPEAPGHLEGFGPIPAWLGRLLVREADRVWVRRLFTDPTTGELAATEARSRFFPEGLRRLIVARDQVCRTPWCDAPIRHLDHIAPVHEGGATSLANGQGLCARCNQTKELPGWSQSASGEGSDVVVRGPTGHLWLSRAPARRARLVSLSPAERRLASALRAA